MSRYTPEFNAYARRVVKSFNQRVIRAQKRGLSNLPKLRNVRDLKAQFTTEEDLKRELVSLRKFNDNRKALDYKLLDNEAKVTNWEFDYLKDNLDELKSYYDRELEKARARYASSPYNIGMREDVFNLEQKRQYLERNILELNKSELLTFRKYLANYQNRNRTDQNFYESYMESFDFLLRVSGTPRTVIRSIKTKLNSLSPSQFYEFYKRHDVVEDLFNYVPSPERKKYYDRLQEYEQREKERMMQEMGIDSKELNDKLQVFVDNMDEWIAEVKNITD